MLNAVVDDLVGDGLKLLFVGINPGLWTAATAAARRRDRLVPAYRHAFGLPKAVAGRQPARLGGAELWVVPNSSGLNAHASLAALAAAYAEPARAAGVL